MLPHLVQLGVVRNLNQPVMDFLDIDRVDHCVSTDSTSAPLLRLSCIEFSSMSWCIGNVKYIPYSRHFGSICPGKVVRGSKESIVGGLWLIASSKGIELIDVVPYFLVVGEILNPCDVSTVLWWVITISYHRKSEFNTLAVDLLFDFRYQRNYC